MPYANPAKRREYQRAWEGNRRASDRAARVAAGELIQCPDCNLWRSRDHRCLVVYNAKAHDANRNPGTAKQCMDCGRRFTSHMPLNLMWRPQRCPACLVEHERERDRQRYGRRIRESIPIAEFWPYGATGWPFDAVNNVVPRTLPEAIRADVCQDLCLMVIAGEIAEQEIAVALRGVIRRNYGDWAVSLDHERIDGFKWADRVSYDDDGSAPLYKRGGG